MGQSSGRTRPLNVNGAQALALAVAVFLGVGSASAQQAERAGGPLRFAGISKDAAYFIVGPQKPPAGPFAIWQWRFLKEAKGPLEAAASLITVDCRANTRQMVLIEGYGRGRFLRAEPANPENGKLVKPQPGMVSASVQQEACRPNSMAKQHTAADYRKGQELADRMFGKKPAAPATAAAPSPAASAATRCRAVAAVMVASHDQSVKMGKMLLAMGRDNGADLAKTRKTVADAEAKLAQTQAVLRRYASAPAPNAALIKQLNDTKISELNAEIERCAGGGVATARTAPTPSAARPPAAAATKEGWEVSMRRTAAGLPATYTEASQIDPTGRFALVYSCEHKYKGRTARIYSSIAFEATTSYAPEVPLKISVDGKPAQEFSLRFQRMPHFARVKGDGGRDLVAVDLTMYNGAANLDRFIALVRTAKSSIAISYFDKSMRFAPEPGFDSFAKVEAACARR